IGAVKELSRARLEDTLYSEFAQTKRLVERLTGGQFLYTSDELAKALGIDVHGVEFTAAVEVLKDSGFMRESRNRVYSVPVLYRYALGMQMRRQGRRVAPDADRRVAKQFPARFQHTMNQQALQVADMVHESGEVWEIAPVKREHVSALEL